MNQERRRELVRIAGNTKLTWRGKRCSIGGWKNDYAGIASDLGGFWGIRWEDLERVLKGESTLDEENIWFISGAWLGMTRDG